MFDCFQYFQVSLVLGSPELDTVLQKNPCLFLSQKTSVKGDKLTALKKKPDHSETLWGLGVWDVSALISDGPSYHIADSEKHRHFT